MGHRLEHVFDRCKMRTNLTIHSKLTFILSADAATSCDLFLFLSGGNVNMGDGRVMVEPPSDSLDPIAAPRHCVALDYLYATVSIYLIFMYSCSYVLQISHKSVFCSVQCVFQPMSLEGRAFRFKRAVRECVCLTG